MVTNSSRRGGRADSGLALAIGLATVSAGCGGSSAPTPPRDLPRGCALGPIPISTSGPDACTTLSPRCPRPRPPAARTLVWVGTCSSSGRTGACEAIQLPGCPTDSKIAALRLVNLKRNDSRPCPSAGKMRVDVRATPDGGARFLWDAQEPDPATCKPTRPEMEGEQLLEGPCCSRQVDVYFPINDLTARVVVRTDWQP